jgi:hypothetical protein
LIGTTPDEHPGDVHMVGGDGAQQGCASPGVARLEVGAVRERCPRSHCASAGGRTQQSGLRGQAARRLPQDGGDGIVPTPLGVRDRSDAIGLGGQHHVGPGRDELPHHVDMGGPARSQDDRLVQGGPAQFVHVVDLDAGGQQPLDDRREPALRRPDESGPVETVPGG